MGVGAGVLAGLVERRPDCASIESNSPKSSSKAARPRLFRVLLSGVRKKLIAFSGFGEVFIYNGCSLESYLHHKVARQYPLFGVWRLDAALVASGLRPLDVSRNA